MASAWQRVKTVFQDVVELAPHERAAFLDRACAGEPSLLAQVQRLLSQHSDSAGGAILSSDVPRSPEPSLEAGTVVGRRFRILRLAGHGGMGEVYEAADEELGGRVALKIIRPAIAMDAAFMGRFRREVQLARRVTHPNISRIFDSGRDQTSPEHPLTYFTMEYVDGVTLASHLLNHGPMPVTEALPLVRQMAAGLSALHQQGVVHRDFKPGNVMLSSGPDGTRAVITDFGLAHATTDDAQTITVAGALVGTPDYMAPEQLMGKPATPRSDVYALGLVIYEMVTGQKPYQGEGLKRLTAAPVPPRRLAPHLSKTWDAAILACLDRDPENRPASPSAVMEALSANTPLRLPGTRRRWRWLAVPGLASALALAAFWFRGGATAPQPVVSAVTTFAGSKDFASISPDGKSIAFTWVGIIGPVDLAQGSGRFRTLYVKPVDGGEPRPLTKATSDELIPTWSPDGKQIAFLRKQGNRFFVYTVPAAGGDEKFIGEGGVALSWSPDGESLLLASPADQANRNYLLIYSLKTGERRRLTSPEPASDSFGYFSPDGKSIAFIRSFSISAREVMTVPVEGGEPTRLTFDQRAIWGIAWSPSGKDIIFCTNRGGGEQLWRVPAAGGAPARIPLTPHNAFNPSVAPRAGRLVYTEVYVDTNLYLHDLASGGPPRMVAQSTREDHSPEFAPDGSRFAFVSKRTGSDEIWLADRDGHSPVQLTHFDGPATGSPRWSPDGRLIAFDSRAHGRAGIYVVDAAGGQPRLFSPAAFDERVPSWSQDGKWIYFDRVSGPEIQVWKRHVSSGAELQITREQSGEMLESPDGRTLYFAGEFGHKGLFTVPVGGGEPKAIPELADAGYWRFWGVTRQGVFFIPAEGDHRSVKLFDWATKQTKTIARLGKAPMWLNKSGAVSPDGRWMISSELDQSVNDILMIDHFR